jgi:NADH-quinone oxidoreductase subunit L
MNKYGFDALNDIVFVSGSKLLGRFFYQVGDQRLIDGFFVNGSGRLVRWFSTVGRTMQNGYLYHYVTTMVFGLFALLCWLLLR